MPNNTKTHRAVLAIHHLRNYYQDRVDDCYDRGVSPERDRLKRGRCGDILDTLREAFPPTNEIEYYIKCLNVSIRQEVDISCMTAQQIETHPLIKATEALGELVNKDQLTKLYNRMTA